MLDVDFDFDRLMDATQTVIQLKPGVALSAEDVAEIHFAFEYERKHEEDAVDAYARGYSHGLKAAGDPEKGALVEKVERLQTELAVAKALNRYWAEAEKTECKGCGGSGKIVDEARTTGANQHSACQRDCEDCDGKGRVGADPD